VTFLLREPRTRESLRVAIGAQSLDVLGMIMGRSLLLAGLAWRSVLVVALAGAHVMPPTTA